MAHPSAFIVINRPFHASFHARFTLFSTVHRTGCHNTVLWCVVRRIDALSTELLPEVRRSYSIILHGKFVPNGSALLCFPCFRIRDLLLLLSGLEFSPLSSCHTTGGGLWFIHTCQSKEASGSGIANGPSLAWTSAQRCGTALVLFGLDRGLGGCSRRLVIKSERPSSSTAATVRLVAMVGRNFMTEEGSDHRWPLFLFFRQPQRTADVPASA